MPLALATLEKGAKQVGLTLIQIKALKIGRRYFHLVVCAFRDAVCCGGSVEGFPIRVA